MSAGGRGRATLAGLLAVAGGLATAGGTAAPWVRLEVERDIGGVPVGEVETVGGLELAPALLPLGLAAALVGLALLLVPGRVRQALGGLALLAGLAAAALLVAGLGGPPPDGTFGAGVAFAAFGALALVTAGALGLRPAPPARLPPRYDLDDDDEDAEWRLASDEDEEG